MQVLPCSDAIPGSEKAFVYDEEANNVQPEIVQGVDNKLDDAEMSNDEQFVELDVLNNTRDSVVDSLELPAGNQECESSRSEPEWLEQDQPMPVWVKWRGKWQAGIRCARSDWPLLTVRAKPRHDRKQYLVIFFPRKRNYSWADVLLLRPINEYPEPIAYRSHNAAVKVVKDLTVARRYIIQKIAVSMINTIEQLNSEALTENARSVVVWKEFALEASRCKDYSDLGNMLLKLEKMILQHFINSNWLENSHETWARRCQTAHSAEFIEMLKEELSESIKWNEVQALPNSNTDIGSEWRTLKPEVMKWFSMSNPSFNTENTEPQNNDGFPNPGLQVSRKRAKLEIRRAETAAPPVDTLYNWPIVPLGSEVSLTETSEPDRWGAIVVEPGTSSQEAHLRSLEMTPTDKNKCAAFIEAKGRRCVRWANDGDIYCCVHLSARFSANVVKQEVNSPPTDAHLCDGITVLGTKCKHRALPGSSSCKKHRSGKEIMVFSPPPPENKLKRKLVDEVGFPEVNNCKELVLAGHFGTHDPEPNAVGIEYNVGGPLRCVGDGVGCNETPTRHTLYCDNHLPNWLKRARNGKSRIISKDVFIDLLKSCQSHEQKLHLHRACELFYKFFKSVLSLRSPVPKDMQLQWVVTEASKDVNTGHFLMKLVCSEKERLVRVWGFNSDTVAQIESFNVVMSNNNDDIIVKCSICSLEFVDDQALAKHWVDNHKNEARSLFKRYVCAICLDPFPEYNLLEAHVKERHSVEFVEQCMLYQCIPCGNRFGSPDQLWAHVVLHHPANFKQLQNALPVPPHDDGNDSIKVQNVFKNNSSNLLGLQRFVCRFCLLRFDLLPDLGRHHQAFHMLTSGGPRKLKAGRRFKKGLGMRNRGLGGLKKLNQGPFRQVTEGELQVYESNQSVSLGRLTEPECSNVAKLLHSKITKTKPHPGSLELLRVACSACCKTSFQTLLEKKYGKLPERLYLKAAKLCSERGVVIEWHQEGYICPKGCNLFNDDSDLLLPLKNLPERSVRAEEETSQLSDWPMDGSHHIVHYNSYRQESTDKSGIVLCDDISFGKESVPVACVVDEHLLASLHNDDERSNACFLPWESFTYVTKSLVDKSVNLESQSLQLGCGCAHLTCSPKGCDHVYLFDNDYEDAKDFNGKSMKGRFPYDNKGRIILEEGYLVYECNRYCNCNKYCPNRVLQNGVRVKLEVFKTEGKGWAVRAGERIERGTFVCEYVGEVIDKNEANKRRNRLDKEDSSFIYDIDARVNDVIRLSEGEASYAIDTTKYGNVSRYINHSCSPNLENHQVLIESLDSELSHIGLYASRDIAAGEELNFDYMYKAPPGKGRECRCGSANCRGQVQ
ncbi:histone-lysine N-methyltransferase SUVR5-like [Bidens hawaiensis]|uniref:histone-lysine N-methyltransferase SUVR5-like n=1 Tax=Bidens hawaiensis TaxID=980011 RepID=UPI00404A473F